RCRRRGSSVNARRGLREKASGGLRANRGRAEGWLAQNAILVTALSPVIGYGKGAEGAKEALRTGRTIREVVLEKGYLTEEQVDELLDARKMTEGGIMS